MPIIILYYLRGLVDAVPVEGFDIVNTRILK